MTTSATDFHAGSAIEGRFLRRETWTSTDHWPAEWTTIHHKSYPRRPRLALTAGAPVPPMSLVSALRTRASQRTPTGAPLPLAVLSRLLQEVFGPGRNEDGEPDPARRSYPSAGARFPTECYVIAQRTAGLEPGVYHYDVPGHGLHVLRTSDVADDVRRCFGFPWIAASRAVLVVTAALPRTTCKYGERGYRFALLEAGHACENALLVATAFGVPATPVGGFADAPLARLLGLAGGDEPPLATLVLP